MSYTFNLQEICEGKSSFFSDEFYLPLSTEAVDPKDALTYPLFAAVFIKHLLDLKIFSSQLGLEITYFDFVFDSSDIPQKKGRIIGHWQKLAEGKK